MSVIIPAFNEERYLAPTLQALIRSAQQANVPTELILVDNESTDRTPAIAQEFGCKIVNESQHNIGRVRNAGAAASSGNILVFVDADTIVPKELLARIYQEVAENDAIGGAVDTLYNPSSRIIRLYLSFWRWFGHLMKLAQGATQFCRRDVFNELGGYDETIFMGEDVDFYHRLRKLGKPVSLITELRVSPSTRRFDQWPLWRTLIWTNPLFIAFLRRTRSVWKGWYRSPPR